MSKKYAKPEVKVIVVKENLLDASTGGGGGSEDAKKHIFDSEFE